MGDFQAASMTGGAAEEGHGRGREVGEREREGGRILSSGKRREAEAWERRDSAVCMLATGAPICSLLISGWGTSGTVL